MKILISKTWNAAKAVFKRKYVTKNVYIRKEKLKVKDLRSHIKNLKKGRTK